jgi:hypothetical protein
LSYDKGGKLTFGALAAQSSQQQQTSIVSFFLECTRKGLTRYLFGKLHEHVVRGSSGAPESQWEAARERDEEFPRGDVAVGRAS